MFRPNFTSGLLQVILPRPRIGMMSLVTVSPVITAFHSCCLSHHVFDQIYPLSPFGARGAADRGVESLRFLVSLSEDNGFKSYPSRPEVYLFHDMTLALVTFLFVFYIYLTLSMSWLESFFIRNLIVCLLNDVSGYLTI